MENPVLERRTLCLSSYKNRKSKTVMGCSSRKKRGVFLHIEKHYLIHLSLELLSILVVFSPRCENISGITWKMQIGKAWICIISPSDTSPIIQVSIFTFFVICEWKVTAVVRFKILEGHVGRYVYDHFGALYIFRLKLNKE